MTTRVAGQGEQAIDVVAPRSLLIAAAPPAVGLAVLHLVIFLAYGAVTNAIGAVLILAYLAVLAAGWVAVQRDQPRTAIVLTGGGLIAVAVALAAFVPTTRGLVLIAPIVLVALAMTYVSRTRLGGLAIAAWLAGLGIVVLLQVSPEVGTNAPPAVVAILRIVQSAVGLAFAIFLLWQFSSRLDLALNRMSAANTALSDSQDTVKRVNSELLRQVDELELRNREATLVGHMGSLLEVSQTADEAYGVIARGARLLFPGLSGALYVLPPNRLVVERVATWGVEPDTQRIYRPDDCWALRQGRLFIVDGPDSGPTCGHVGGGDAIPYMCIPLTAQGATLGVFHLSEDWPDVAPASADVPSSPGPATATATATAQPTAVDAELRTADVRLTESARSLGLWVAELLALSLANFRLRETLHAQSTRDPLTGLYNRRYMEDSLERELYRAAREEGTLGVVMADLDHFKAFNDRSGHVAGDEVLRSLAALLSSSVRAEDIVCRYGGEEFTILLPNASLEETQARAEVLRAAAAALVVADGQRLTLSLGVAAFPRHGATATELIGVADAALYTAKSTGRDRVVAAA
ncbi:MAG: GGDEF domain-containing protein [Chloroflexi bacterium]|nr:GGDEF domain-containing protein [Chloroflexota bacterium]